MRQPRSVRDALFLSFAQKSACFFYQDRLRTGQQQQNIAQNVKINVVVCKQDSLQCINSRKLHVDVLNCEFAGHSAYKDYISHVVDPNDVITAGRLDYVVTDECALSVASSSHLHRCVH
jgi:hypothetical protein